MCKRWQNISQQHAWSDIKELHLTSKSNCWTPSHTYSNNLYDDTCEKVLHNRALEKLLLRCGRFLIQVIIYVKIEFQMKNRRGIHGECLTPFTASDIIQMSDTSSTEILPLIGKYCSNITELRLNLEKYPEDKMAELFAQLQNLEYLKMSNLEEAFTGDCLQMLPHKKVKEISLSHDNPKGIRLQSSSEYYSKLSLAALEVTPFYLIILILFC